VQGRGNGVAMMATDTTALATAIAAMRAAVAAGDVANEPRQLSQAALNEVRATVFAEADAGRALLAALSGVPERLAALEVAATAATDLLEENAWGDGAFAGVWAIDEYGQGVIVNLRDTLAALAGEVQE